MELEPKKFDLCLIYKCPKCKDDNWFSAEEIKCRSGFVCCGKLWKVRPIQTVKVAITFNKTISTKTINDAVAILKKHGFSKQQILSANIEATTTTEFVKKFLSLQ